MSKLRALGPALPILIGASLMLSLSMGLRQSLGIFMPPLTKDVGISVSDFTLAVAVQNLAWGFLQPWAGAVAVRLGYKRLMLAGSLLYIVGLVLLGWPKLGVAQGMWTVIPLPNNPIEDAPPALVAVTIAARARGTERIEAPLIHMLRPATENLIAASRGTRSGRSISHWRQRDRGACRH